MQQTPIQVGEYSFTILIEPSELKIANRKSKIENYKDARER
jgi:hypothetical protein